MGEYSIRSLKVSKIRLLSHPIKFYTLSHLIIVLFLMQNISAREFKTKINKECT